MAPQLDAAQHILIETLLKEGIYTGNIGVVEATTHSLSNLIIFK